MVGFTFGCDPEFMLLSPAGTMVSAVGSIPGTKDKPQPLGRHTVHHDNVMAEVAIVPGGSRQETLDSIQDCLSNLARMVRPNRLVCRAAYYYEREELRSQDAREAFCRPEYCAYTLKPKKGNLTAFRRNSLRTAGGHVHLGTDLATAWYGSVSFARMMDLFVGVPSVLINHDYSETLRKALYGRAGRYREPEHGVEYRSLGNFWLASPKLAGLVYDLSEFVVQFIADGKHLDLWTIEEDKLRDAKRHNARRFDASRFHHCTGYDANRLRLAINNVDRNLAWEFMAFIRQYLPARLYDDVVRHASPREFDPYCEWSLN